jgi:hypothetical protein
MNLISLTVNDRDVVLGTDFNVRFTFSFPLPYNNNVPVASTYWFTLPVEGNEITFAHVNQLNSAKNLKAYNIKAIVSGLCFVGKIYVKNASNREYKAFAVFNDLFETLSSKKISECVDDVHTLGTDTASVLAAAKTMSQQAWPLAKYAFPFILNELFYGDINEQYVNNGQFMNNYDRNGQAFRNNYLFEGTVYNNNVMVPMPYLFFIIDHMMKKVGWTVIGNVFKDENFKKLVFYNNYSLENIADPNAMQIKIDAMVQMGQGNTNIKINFNQEVFDNADNFIAASSEFTCKEAGTYNYSFYSFISFWNELGNTATIVIYIYDGSTFTELQSVDWTDPDYLTKDCQINGTVELLENTTYSIYYSYNFSWGGWMEKTSFQVSQFSDGINRFSNKVRLTNHVPNLTTSEFFTELMKKFSFAIFFDFINKKIELEHWNNIIDSNNYLDLSTKVVKDSEDSTIEERDYSFTTEWDNDELIEESIKNKSKYSAYSKVANYASLPTPTSIGQVVLVVNLNKFYITYLNVETNSLEWKYNSDNFEDVVSEMKDPVTISTKINTLFERQGTVVYPEIKQQGTTPELGNNDPGFKLLNYHGFVTNYPFASNTNYNQAGAKITGVALQTQGNEGTYETYGKKLYDYLRACKPLEINFAIDNDDFIQISKLFVAGNQIRKVRLSNKNYIPESFDITISSNKIESCKAKLL